MSKVWKGLGLAAIVLVLINLVGFDPIGSLRDKLFGVDQRPEAAATTLLTIRRTTELRAATGEFSVPVYFGTEQDGVVHEVLPDAFDGNSGVAIYQGSVDAFVDLKGLTTDDLEINRTDRSIVICKPAPSPTKSVEGRSSTVSSGYIITPASLAICAAVWYGVIIFERTAPSTTTTGRAR